MEETTTKKIFHRVGLLFQIIDSALVTSDLQKGRPEMTTKKDWIIADGVTNSVRCLRCGTKQPNPTPCSFDTILMVWNQFLKEHKDCKERNTTEGK